MELLLDRALRAGGVAASPGEALVRSAGTHAVVSSPVDAQVAALLTSDGVAADMFRARQLTAEILREPALVLTLTTTHRSAVVQTLPTALRRTFTLREFARLVDHVDAAALEAVRAETELVPRIKALVAAAQRARATAGPALTQEDLDIADPYRRADDVHAEVYAQITRSVETVARALRN